MPAYQAAPRVRIGATLAQVFTLLTTVGLPHRPLRDRIRRPRPRLAGVAFDRLDQGRLFAADVGPAPRRTLTRNDQPLPKMLSPSSPQLSASGDGVLERRDGQRVFAADVDEALAGADGVGSR